MNRIVLTGILSSALMASGCAYYSVDISKSGGSHFSSYKENCQVDIYTTKPDKPFKEVGIVDVTYHHRAGYLFSSAYYVTDKLKVASGFRDHIAKDVCKVGGNAILLHEKDFTYKIATILRVEK